MANIIDEIMEKMYDLRLEIEDKIVNDMRNFLSNLEPNQLEDIYQQVLEARKKYKNLGGESADESDDDEDEDVREEEFNDHVKYWKIQYEEYFFERRDEKDSHKVVFEECFTNQNEYFLKLKSKYSEKEFKKLLWRLYKKKEDAIKIFFDELPESVPEFIITDIIMFEIVIDKFELGCFTEYETTSFEKHDIKQCDDCANDRCEINPYFIDEETDDDEDYNKTFDLIEQEALKELQRRNIQTDETDYEKIEELLDQYDAEHEDIEAKLTEMVYVLKSNAKIKTDSPNPIVKKIEEFIINYSDSDDFNVGGGYFDLRGDDGVDIDMMEKILELNKYTIVAKKEPRIWEDEVGIEEVIDNDLSDSDDEDDDDEMKDDDDEMKDDEMKDDEMKDEKEETLKRPFEEGEEISSKKVCVNKTIEIENIYPLHSNAHIFLKVYALFKEIFGDYDSEVVVEGMKSDFIFHQNGFRRLVIETSQDFGNVLFDEKAFDALQTVAENILIERFEKARKIMDLRENDVLERKDFFTLNPFL